MTECFDQYLDFEVKDWSKMKYVVKCNWGVKVNHEYPAPEIHEYFFESFADVERFVEWYMTENSSLNKKIYHVMELGRRFNIETYEVATKVRLK
jgi:hypothetical protein